MISSSLHGGTWTRLGSNCRTLANDLRLIAAHGSTASYILAATHGRGLWKIATL